MTNQTEVAYYTTGELASRMRVAEQTLRHWRMKRTGPPFVNFGRRVVYSVKGFEKWEAKQTQGGGL